MKTIRNFAVAITLLTTGTTVCKAASTDAINAEMKESLPKGWTVYPLSRKGTLEITKDTEVSAYSTDYKPEPGEKAPMKGYSFVFRIQGEISEESSEQRRATKELDVKIQKLYDSLVALAIPRVSDNFQSKNDEEKDLV